MSKITSQEILTQEAFRIKDLKESIAESYPEALFADGHDHAILGYSQDGRVIYSYNKIIEGLMDSMTHEEAVEYFDFNIGCAYVGEYTPIYMYEE
jgi:hypothetical protein